MKADVRPSFWLNQLPTFVPRKSLGSHVDCDVALIGGGLSGLWTAYYLKTASPSLRVAVFEAKYCGFGASGRNGGWASALLPASLSTIAARYSEIDARRMHLGMLQSLAEIERVVCTQDIDCDFHRGGTLSLARSKAQLRKAEEEVRMYRRFGFADDDYQLLDANEAQDMVRASSVLGATYTPHCARVHPAKLVRGLADLVERLGVEIYENSPVENEPGRTLAVNGCRVNAGSVVRLTEAYSSQLSKSHREVAPVYSMMIVTSRIDADRWSRIGWEGGATLTDFRNLIIYAQPTSDGRIAIGGRGAPYHFGSRMRSAFDRSPNIATELHQALVELLPELDGISIEAHWGGAVALSRDMFPSVGYDPVSGVGWAGGYGGDGVTTSNLSGRTLADLILGNDTELVHLAWVNHRSKAWEPEPLRWAGINSVLALNKVADRAESHGRLRPWQGRVARYLMGHVQ